MAIEREKEIKDMNRRLKEELIHQWIQNGISLLFNTPSYYVMRFGIITKEFSAE